MYYNVPATAKVLKLRRTVFVTDELQFGFKQGMSCTNAVLLCCSFVHHLGLRGNNVCAATVDIKKPMISLTVSS